MNGHGNQQGQWLWLKMALDWTNMISLDKLWTLELFSPVQVCENAVGLVLFLFFKGPI